jgi:hypothetical protein
VVEMVLRNPPFTAKMREIKNRMKKTSVVVKILPLTKEK